MYLLCVRVFFIKICATDMIILFSRDLIARRGTEAGGKRGGASNSDTYYLLLDILLT